MKPVLFVTLALFTAGFAVIWIFGIRHARREGDVAAPGLLKTAIGFVTNFFDTLGIGSFATTTSLSRLWRLVPDEDIPGTLIVGHTPPSILEAFIYIAIIQVDAVTLALMIASATVGAWLGGGVVSRWQRRKVQIGMGSALLAAAAFMLMKALNLFPTGGDLLALYSAKLVIGVCFNLILGALMTIGVGIFAPTMVLVSLLGMNPVAAFPIMMGSGAFLMPVGSIRFIRAKKYNLKAALGLTVGGIPAVLIAAFMVKSLPLAAVRWIVVAVVLYTAFMLLRSAVSERQPPAAAVSSVSSADCAGPPSVPN